MKLNELRRTANFFQNSSRFYHSVETKQTKRKVGLWIAYDGSNYSGIQYNPLLKTVEGDLEEAMIKANLLRDINKGDLYKHGWSRSSRTDRGVHSLKNFVIAKLHGEWLKAIDYDEKGGNTARYYIADQCKDIPNKINPFLSPEIRVISAFPVQKSYDARRKIGYRTYEYLIQRDQLKDTLYETDPEQASELLNEFVGRYHLHNFTDVHHYLRIRNKKDDEEESENKIPKFKKSFPTLISSREDQMKNWKSIPEIYRVIREIKVDTIDIKGEKYVRITIDGESFLIHQIRKMISFWLLLIKGVLPLFIAPIAIKSPLIFRIPLAPPTGLILTDIKELHSETDDITLDETSLKQLEDFKVNQLYPKIAEFYHTNLFSDYLTHEIPKYSLEEDDLKVVKELGDKFLENINEVKLQRKAPRQALQQIIKLVITSKVKPKLYQKSHVRDKLPEHYQKKNNID